MDRGSKFRCEVLFMYSLHVGATDRPRHMSRAHRPKMHVCDLALPQTEQNAAV